MVNTYVKGQALERWLEFYMMKKGSWVMTYRAPHMRWSKNTDIFNYFDGISLSKEGRYHLWQLKSNISDYYSFKKKLLDYCKIPMRSDQVKHYLIWTDKKKIRIFSGDTGGELVQEVERI